MRIAFVTLGYRPFRTSGLDVGSERIVRALLDAGHDVTVIAAQRRAQPETHIHPRLTIKRLPMGRSNWIGYALRAARLLHQLSKISPFDVVHFAEVHFAYAYSGPFVAGLHHSFRQRMLVLRPWPPRQWVQGGYYLLSRLLAERRGLRRAAGLLALSSTARDEFITAYGIPASRIALTRYGTDTDHFRPSPEQAAATRRRLGIGDEEQVLMFAGFVTPRKGLAYLAQAYTYLNRQPRLVITGRWSVEAREQFLALMGEAAHCVVEAGFVPDEEMPAFFSMADIYVSPSLMEGFGLPLAEALACETPVVAADAGSVAEVVGPGGLIVPARDAQALAAAIERLLANQELRRTLGLQGRRHILEEFSVSAMVREMTGAYQRYLSTSTS